MIPGGRAFHSVSYWAEGNGGYQPYYPEVMITELALTLTPPTGGTVFEFLQPVFLQVQLTNRTGQALEMPDWYLDPKQGALQIVVRRVSGGTEATEPRLWVPMMQRCYDVEFRAADFVPDGGSIARNLNLTFGAGGFAFAEPGEYEIQAVVSFPNRNLRREFIVPSNTLRVRIGYPRSREEEQDALVILRDDVGTYFALGGSRVLDKARNQLEGIKERRQGRAKKIKDPIVANIVRCAGIDAGRAYLRLKNGKYVVEKGDRERATELLEQLDDEALRAFDSDTAFNTKRLASKHRKAVESRKSSTPKNKKD